MQRSVNLMTRGRKNSFKKISKAFGEVDQHPNIFEATLLVYGFPQFYTQRTDGTDTKSIWSPQINFLLE